MMTLGDRVDAAIRASGKPANQIARALGINANTITRLRNGKEDNPTLRVLQGIAEQTGTSVAALLGISFPITPDDEHELQRFRRWIDSKLATIDALAEPNAEIISAAPMPGTLRDQRIADRKHERIERPFGDGHLVLRARGESMIGEGILPDDTLYARDPGKESAIGKLIVGRIGAGVFVKRLVSEHDRRFLLSADPRYRPIAVDAEGLSLEIFGFVIGRSGKLR
jgi:transcriptional regulator with XRE-family HTH domain